MSSLQHRQVNAEAVTKPDSTTTKLAPSLLTTGKENEANQHVTTTMTKNNQENGSALNNRRGLLSKEEMSSVYRINQFPTSQTIVLREWIV